MGVLGLIQFSQLIVKYFKLASSYNPEYSIVNYLPVACLSFFVFEFTKLGDVQELEVTSSKGK